MSDALALHVSLAPVPVQMLPPVRVQVLLQALLHALCDADEGGACSAIETLVYISCGFKALRRDADALLDAGEYAAYVELLNVLSQTDASLLEEDDVTTLLANFDVGRYFD